ncbi:AcrR family transcriptional regulator [Novosphingobium hassiacum]|uniref:AcrR family transcriptional regulator n=1 Tax=Novosphingobium hassiacum TaxID=173676 RepID=A0A7W5ZWL0_9SPHN|nr:TetR/AcrR family transcriptional regulator [Novosphingobium hassiacum]MBB3861280.1 AcrR family transcriptional regulator [Novosphingobium hassiacum]
MAEPGTTKRYTQARGRARREALVAAARTLLQECSVDEITLTMVAERASIPASSAYHFFPDIRVLYKELACQLADEMTEIELPAMQYDRWQDCLAAFVGTSAMYLNGDAAARQLLLGPQTAPDIKRAACHDDMRFGAILFSLLDSQFHLPKLRTPVLTCFYAIQIADTFFSLSVQDHQKISEDMLGEALVGATSYLANYFPPILQPKAKLTAVATDAM